MFTQSSSRKNRTGDAALRNRIQERTEQTMLLEFGYRTGQNSDNAPRITRQDRKDTASKIRIKGKAGQTMPLEIGYRTGRILLLEIG